MLSRGGFLRNGVALTAPFPWFGGKSRVATEVWKHLGNVPHYVEPFAGSLAVLLGRPHKPQTESVNDKDAYLANFWRALKKAPQQVARWADWPVNEADLHARHLWLVNRNGFRERMLTDPDYYDAKIAGWWVWGIAQFIGSGWCDKKQYERHKNARPHVSGLSGVHAITPGRTNAARMGGQGVYRKRIHLSGGQGVHRKRIHLGDAGRGVHRQRVHGLYAWFDALAERLRYVRVCCGDWKRILGPAVLCRGLTGVFLDPPYSDDLRGDLYNEESRTVAQECAVWARENGDNPELRIALCGYEGEYNMPSSWNCVHWKASGGYAGFGKKGSQGRLNRHRERIWFSPYCIKATLF